MALPPPNTNTFQEAVKKSQEELEKAKKAGIPLTAVDPNTTRGGSTPRSYEQYVNKDAIYQGPPKGSTLVGSVYTDQPTGQPATLAALDKKISGAGYFAQPAQLQAVDKRRLPTSYTYEQALTRSAQRDVKTPEEAKLIQEALARGKNNMAQQDGTNNLSVTPPTKPNFETKTEELAGKLGTAETQVTPVTQGVQQNELLGTQGQLLSETDVPTVTPKTIDTTQVGQTAKPVASEDLGQVTTPVASAVGYVEGQDFAGATSDFSASDLIDLDDVSSATLSAGAMADPAQEQLDEKATVKYQLESLLGGIEDGEPLPAWASPAARKVAAIMQQRGLGSSSMAAAAMTQAVMESGISIAARDAGAYANIQLKNLDNRQQAALQNALQVATMDRQNADARTKGAISNAQALLSIDIKELDAQQQSNAIKYNAMAQAAFTEAAAENARQQFNAKNELQVEEYFAELGVQVDTANINRDVAIKQYNINQENSFAEFNANMRDQREKFNANMRSVIDQSNVKWRREVNTANTAVQNETNRINAQLMYNMSATAMNDLWQKYRDNATFNFTASESELQRKHEQVIQALEAAANADAYSAANKTTLASNIIKVIGNW